MLYICIFSNKFDLKQTIRVLHNISYTCFTKQAYLNQEVNCTEPSPSVRTPCPNLNLHWTDMKTLLLIAGGTLLLAMQR
jgi:hypothetical protein